MTEVETRGGRAAGAALVSGAAGTMFFMGHHPTHLEPGVGQAVHAALIALLAAIAFGFAVFAVRRGSGRQLVLAGILAYAIALLGHVGAATINGFVVPALAGHGREAVGQDIYLAAWEANQALAKLGVHAAGAAYLLWSLDLLRDKGHARALGAAGLVAGLLPSGLLLSGATGMDVAGAMLIYGLQVLWAALVGVQLWRGRI